MNLAHNFFQVWWQPCGLFPSTRNALSLQKTGGYNISKVSSQHADHDKRAERRGQQKWHILWDMSQVAKLGWYRQVSRSCFLCSPPIFLVFSRVSAHKPKLLVFVVRKPHWVCSFPVKMPGGQGGTEVTACPRTATQKWTESRMDAEGPWTLLQSDFLQKKKEP